MTRVSLAVLLMVAGAGGCGDRSPHKASSERSPLPPVDVSRLVEDSVCGTSADVLRSIWDVYDDAALTALQSGPADARLRVEKALDAIDAPDDRPGIRFSVRLASPRVLAVLTSYQCGMSFAGGRLSTFERSGRRWHLADRRDFEYGATPWIVESSTERGRLLVATSSASTQADPSTLHLMDVATGSIRVEWHRGDLLGLERIERGRLHWYEQPRHLTAPFHSPHQPQFEARADLDRDPPIVVTTATPWIDALEQACDAPTTPAPGPVAPRLPCGARIMDVRPYPRTGLVDVELMGGENEIRCAPPEFDWARNSGDQGTIVTLRASTWEIAGVRAADRMCAVRGDRHPPPRSAVPPGVEVVASPEAALSFAADAEHLYMGADRYLLQRGWDVSNADRIGDEDVRAIALTKDAVYWIPAAAGEIRRADRRGRRTTTLVRHQPGLADLAIGPGGIVYWTDYDGGTVNRLRGRRIDVIADRLLMPWGIAATADHLTVTTAAGLRRVDLASGAVEPLHEAVSPIDVAVAGEIVAWTEATGRVVAVRGAGPERVIAWGGRPTDIAIVGDRVVWLDVAANEIRSVTLDPP